MARGKEHETMPYFLTDQYRQVLKAAQKQDEEDKKFEDESDANVAGAKKKNAPAGESGGAQAGIYKSIFLRTKVEQ